MVVMTAGQWAALAEYMDNVELVPGDEVRISGDVQTIRAQVISVGGTVVDDVDIEADPSEGAGQ